MLKDFKVTSLNTVSSDGRIYKMKEENIKEFISKYEKEPLLCEYKYNYPDMKTLIESPINRNVVKLTNLRMTDVGGGVVDIIADVTASKQVEYELQVGDAYLGIKGYSRTSKDDKYTTAVIERLIGFDLTPKSLMVEVGEIANTEVYNILEDYDKKMMKEVLPSLRTRVNLQWSTPLLSAAQAARKCWKSGDRSDSLPMQVCNNCGADAKAQNYGENNCPYCGHKGVSPHIGDKDKQLLKRMITLQHESILEHIVFHFDVYDMPRTVLQEASRNRMGMSPSVESSRFVLKKVMRGMAEDEYDRYFYFTGDEEVDALMVEQIETLKKAMKLNKSNDAVKHLMPEGMYCNASYTINLRALRHFMRLRLSPAAYGPIQYLAELFYQALPQSYLFLVEDIKEELACKVIDDD